MNIKKPNVIIDQIREVIADWNSYAKKTEVEKTLTTAIGKPLVILLSIKVP